MKLSNKELMQDTLWTPVGNTVLAMGVTWFILPNGILTGGLAGVAVMLESLIHLNPELVINVLTTVLFLVGSLVLGKKFVIKTILSTICYPLLPTLLSYLVRHVTAPSIFTMGKHLATVYGGALMGTGVGCVSHTGASTGGMDTPSLIVNEYTHMPLPTLVLIVDTLTVLPGAAVYGSQAILIEILLVWISSYTINKTMMVGGYDVHSVMIIPSKHTEVMDRTHEVLECGTTILEATGGYSPREQLVIMVVVPKKQPPELEHLMLHTDPGAFVIIMEANEVRGLGFTYEGKLQFFLYDTEAYRRRWKHAEF